MKKDKLEDTFGLLLSFIEKKDKELACEMKAEMQIGDEFIDKFVSNAVKFSMFFLLEKPAEAMIFLTKKIIPATAEKEVESKKELIAFFPRSQEMVYKK